MMKILIVIILAAFNIGLQAQQNEEPYTYTEKMPEFPGGMEEMYKYVYSNLKYPIDAKKNKITGQVNVQFRVEKDGEIDSIKVVRGIGYGCDEEAKRIVASMNDGYKWTPGSHHGHPVPVTFTLPIKFVLN